MGASKANVYLNLKASYDNVMASVSATSLTHRVTHTLKSVGPFLVFLLLYFSNGTLAILPTLEDLACVHIYTLNRFEALLFGCHPHRVLSAYHTAALDVLAAVPYLMHYIIPVVFPAYLLLRGHADDVARFYWLLGWVMWVHYLAWLVFPHTPPWVIDSIERYNSTSPSVMKHREGCAFARLDAATGVPFFYNMFTGNPIPYASFPSGHVAWPTVAFLVAPSGGNYLALYILWVVWATLYSCHHYVLDALGAVVIVVLTQKVLVYLSDKQACSSDYKCRSVAISCPFPV